GLELRSKLLAEVGLLFVWAWEMAGQARACGVKAWWARVWVRRVLELTSEKGVRCVRGNRLRAGDNWHGVCVGEVGYGRWARGLACGAPGVDKEGWHVGAGLGEEGCCVGCEVGAGTWRWVVARRRAGARESYERGEDLSARGLDKKEG
ncbi:unnamed protein product, partial [Dovyalis caffra]